MKDKFIWGVVGLTLILMGAVVAFATINDSPTSDEPPHILSGYVFLRYGHNFIDPEHPLLTKSLAAVPLLFQNVAVDLTDPNYTQQRYITDTGRMFDTSRNFLIFDGNNPDQILFWSRLPMIILTAVFGIVIFLISRKLFGNWGGILAVFLYATEPLILAHGALVNTDIAAAGFIITSVYALILYSEKQSRGHLVFLILALSAALLSKFSTFYLLPVTILLMFFIYKTKKLKLYTHLAILLVGVFSCISIFYGILGFQDIGFLAFIPGSYLGGLVASVIAVSSSDRFSYLLGESYTGAKIYYFPVLVATKTQLLTLLGTIVAAVLIVLKKIKLPKIELVIFFTPLLVFLVLALNAKFNIGIRHVSPIYPFLIILASAGFVGFIHLLTKNMGKTLRLSTIAVFLLTLFSLRGYSIVSTYPHFLSYYNIIAGGTDSGWKVANDSNYDWGQDVKRLAEFVRNNKINSLGFDNYTGIFAAQDYYKLPVFQFSPDRKDYKGYLALSTSTIAFHEDKPENYAWVVDNYKPVARAGKSIFIYKID